MEVDVKIKRYMAASMRVALSQVRAEQGPDAVILSSRRVNEGIEVIAAVDYDEALTAMDIAPDVAMSLALLAPRGTSLKNPANIPLALLARHLQVVDNLSPVSGGMIAVVGPRRSPRSDR